MRIWVSTGLKYARGGTAWVMTCTDANCELELIKVLLSLEVPFGTPYCQQYLPTISLYNQGVHFLVLMERIVSGVTLYQIYKLTALRPSTQ